MLDRLSTKFLVGDGCWPWTAGKDEDGYGQFSMGKGQNRRATRMIYELLVGPIPEGMVLDHMCHDPEVCVVWSECPHRSCVNPGHLEPKSSGDNTRRKVKRPRPTHCPQGHEYTPENTFYGRKKPLTKLCRECSRIRMRVVKIDQKVQWS